MGKEQVKAVLDRVLTWPRERQEDAAKVLMLMESQDESLYPDRRTGRGGRASACRSEPSQADARRVQRAAEPSPRRMKVVVREAAATDLDDILDWISRDNPRAAAELVRHILAHRPPCNSGSLSHRTAGSGRRNP